MEKIKYPTISILTVVRNHHAGLLKTANSILSQKSTDFEWVIVDGISDDGTENLVHKFGSHPNVRSFESAPAGIYNAMNIAAEKAMGNFIWFINAGDHLLSDESVSRIINVIQSTKDIKMLATSVLYISPSGFIYDIKKPSIKFLHQYKVADFHHQGVIVERDTFFHNGGFDESLKYAADGKLLDKIIESTKPNLFSESFVGFEMGGSSSQHFLQLLNEIETYRPSTMSYKIKIILVIRNWVRSHIIRLDKVNCFRPVLFIFLRLKQKKTLDAILLDVD